LTNRIEQLRKENAMRGLVDKDSGEVIKTQEEEQMQA
jgi:hypothetical protein